MHRFILLSKDFLVFWLQYIYLGDAGVVSGNLALISEGVCQTVSCSFRHISCITF